MLKASITLILVFLIGLNFSAADVYIVNRGETLTDILYFKNIKPLYGKNGYLKQALKLNPHIKQNGGNKIYPKMKIFLPTMTSQTVLSSLPDTFEKEQVQESLSPVIRAPANNFQQNFFYVISPSVSWKSLSSTDENIYRRSEVKALSKPNYGARMLYGMRFKEDISIYTKLYVESVFFSPDGEINLAKSNFLATSFGMGVLYQKSIQLELSMSDELFLTSPASLSVEIKKVILPEMKASMHRNFYSYKEATLAFSFSGSLFLPRSPPGFKTELGYGVGGAIMAKLTNQSFKMGFDTNFLKAVGNSTNYKNIYWEYGWESK